MANLIISSSSSDFAVYRSKGMVLALTFVAIAGCLGFGITFLLLPLTPFKVFGVVFTGFGVWILATLPRRWSAAVEPHGFLEWSASAKGMRVARGIGSPSNDYAWSDIERVVIAEKFRQRSSGEKTYAWRHVFVFFKPGRYANESLIASSTAQRSKSPERGVFVLSNYPKNEQEAVRAGIARFAPPSVRVDAVDRLEFDWIEKRTQLFAAESSMPLA